MAALEQCTTSLSRLCISSSLRTRTYTCAKLPSLIQSFRHASTSSKKKSSKAKVKVKKRNTFLVHDLEKATQYSLLDAIRYIRAAEVGYSPSSVKYEMHLKLKTLKDGPIVRNRLRLPHPVKTDVRICVICPPDSKHAVQARAAGAVLVGEDEVIEQIKDGTIDFDRCICQVDSFAKLNQAGLGRILGPRGLMPSPKLKTVVKDVGGTVKEMVGASEYRERLGVVRMAVGQLGFTPEELRINIKAFIDSVKRDMTQISDKVRKDLHEVVLSSTHGPGFSLNGTFKHPDSPITPRDLSIN